MPVSSRAQKPVFEAAVEGVLEVEVDAKCLLKAAVVKPTVEVRVLEVSVLEISIQVLLHVPGSARKAAHRQELSYP